MNEGSISSARSALVKKPLPRLMSSPARRVAPGAITSASAAVIWRQASWVPESVVELRSSISGAAQAVPAAASSPRAPSRVAAASTASEPSPEELQRETSPDSKPSVKIDSRAGRW